MYRIVPLLLFFALLVAGPAAAQQPAPGEQPLSAAELASLQQRIEQLEARMSRDLEARIERQTARWLAARIAGVEPGPGGADDAEPARIRH